MSSIQRVAEHLQTVLTAVAEEAARTSGGVQRVRKFSGATLVQTLVLGWMSNPAASLEELTRLAATRGVQLSAQALEQRFTPALAACLAQVLEQVVQTVVPGESAASPLLDRFSGVYVLDTTTITVPAALAATWPGCGGNAEQGQAAIKLGVQFELGQGTLAGPELVAGRANDRSLGLAQQPVPAGSRRLADLGFFKVGDLARIAAEDGYFLTRWQANTTLYDPDGTRWTEVAGCLAARAGREPGEILDVPVRLGASEQVPMRLLALRVPAEVAASRRRAKRRRAQRNGYTARQASLAVCDWTLVLTNVEVERLSAEEALVLLRQRWQIELLFRRWQAGNGVDAWRSTKPERIRCELYAKLLGCLLQHWMLVVGCWHIPDRSLDKASQVVRLHAFPLLQTIEQLEPLVTTLTHLTTMVTVGCRLTRRKGRPNAAQLLLDPSLGGLA